MIRVPDTESILASSFELLTKFIIHNSASSYLMLSFCASMLSIAITSDEHVRMLTGKFLYGP